MPADEITANRQRSVLLKRLLLVFWSIWLTLVFTTNLFDGAKAIGLLADSWKFASGNYRLLADATRLYDPPAWVNGALFLGVICWEGLAAFLFWRAWWNYRGGKRVGGRTVFLAFTVSLGLWAAFLVANEVLINYRIEAVFLGLLTAQLATLLAIELLPEGS